MLCDIQLKLGELVKVIKGPNTGDTGIIQDILGKRTYVMSNNTIVDRYDIEVISKEVKAIELIKEYLDFKNIPYKPGTFESILARMKEIVKSDN